MALRLPVPVGRIDLGGFGLGNRENRAALASMVMLRACFSRSKGKTTSALSALSTFALLLMSQQCERGRRDDFMPCCARSEPR